MSFPWTPKHFRNVGGFDAGQGGLSLIYDPADSPIVSITPGVSGNRRTFTINILFMVTKLDTYQSLFMAYGAANDNGAFVVSLDTSNRLVISGNSTTWRVTKETFVDTVGLHNLTIGVDSTDATAADRMRIYKGQREITDFDMNSAVALNHEFAVNHTFEHRLGHGFGLGPAIFSGLYNSFAIVDGTQLAGSDFVELDDRNVEMFSEYSGAYGTNGSLLRFNDASTQAALGTNSKGTDWSVTGVDTDASCSMSWAKLFPTLSVVDPRGGVATVSHGSLRITGNDRYRVGSIVIPPNGKWCFAAKARTINAGQIGIGLLDRTKTPGAGAITTDFRIATNNSFKYGAAGAVAYGDGWAVGDEVVCLINMDDGELGYIMDNVLQTVAFTDLVSSGIEWVPYFGTFNDTGAWDVNFGQLPVSTTVIPADYNWLSTDNREEPVIPNGAKHFDIVLWTGDDTDDRLVATQFDADLIELKNRDDNSNHAIHDRVRGDDKSLASNDGGTQSANTGYFAWVTGGFEVSFSGSAGNSSRWNANLNDYVGRLYKMNGAGSTNNDGSVTATVSANQLAGQSIVSWTRTAADQTIGHGLSEAPTVIFEKEMSAANWRVFHRFMNGGAEGYDPTDNLHRNLSNGYPPGLGAATRVRNVGASTFQLAGGSNAEQIAYCFHDVPGFRKTGWYGGTGAANTAVYNYCGFRPKRIRIKRVDAAGGFVDIDTTRDVYNLAFRELFENDAIAEATTGTLLAIDATGFRAISTGGAVNNAGGIFVFIAEAEIPTGGQGVAPAPAF